MENEGRDKQEASLLFCSRAGRGIEPSVVLPKYRYLANDTCSKLFGQTAMAEPILSTVRRVNEALETLH